MTISASFKLAGFPIPTLAFVIVSDSQQEAIINYAAKLKFDLILGDGNNGW